MQSECPVLGSVLYLVESDGDGLDLLGLSGGLHKPVVKVETVVVIVPVVVVKVMVVLVMLVIVMGVVVMVVVVVTVLVVVVTLVGVLRAPRTCG